MLLSWRPRWERRLWAHIGCVGALELGEQRTHTHSQFSDSVSCTLWDTRYTSTGFATRERAVARHKNGSADVRHLGREAAFRLQTRLQCQSERFIIHDGV